MTVTTSTERWTRLRNRWLLAALAAPLVVLPWAYDTAELPKLAFLRLVALGLILTGLFTVSRSAWASANEKQISDIHPLRLPIMLFLIVMGASAFLSPDRWSSLAAFTDLAMLAFFAFSFTGAARDPAFQTRAMRTLVGVGGICAAWGLLQFTGHDPLNGVALRRAEGVPVGPFSHPVILAGFLASLFPLAVGMSLAGKAGRSGLIHIAFIALMLGASRLALPVAGAGVGTLIVLALLQRSGVKLPLRNLAVPAVAALLLFAGGAAGRAPIADESLGAVHRAAVEVVKAQPALGWGPGAFGLVAPRFAPTEAGMITEPNRSPGLTPRNLPLSILAAGGGAAFLIFLWIVAGAGAQLYRRMSAAGPSDVEKTDAGQAALWSGFLAAWLVQSWAAPDSIALMAPFWCALGLASTPARAAALKGVEYRPWPIAIKFAGAMAALLLALPLPHPSSISMMKQGLRPSLDLGSELVAGPGAAVRWIIGDVYYAGAVRARERGNWDAALTAHLRSLMWAPSRMDNWRGYGETAYAAVKAHREGPLQWLQYGKLGYYRARQMQPANGFLYYGEGRLLAEAVRRGGDQFYPEAQLSFERAIALYPRVARFYSEYGRLLELKGEEDRAAEQYRKAASLGAAAMEGQNRPDRLSLRDPGDRSRNDQHGEGTLRFSQGWMDRPGGSGR